MKKYLLKTLSLLSLTLLLASCGGSSSSETTSMSDTTSTSDSTTSISENTSSTGDILPTELSVSPSELSFAPNTIKDLSRLVSYAVGPSNATNKNVVYSTTEAKLFSLDGTIIDVNDDEGTGYVTLSCVANPSVKKDIKIIVGNGGGSSTTYISSSSEDSSTTSSSSTSTSTGEYGGYYDSITDDLEGEALLIALQKLNAKKRVRTVGYKAALNNPSKGFYITDPGDTPGSTIRTFYSGRNNNGTSGLNREHVWPDSRGGSYVEDDIHMPRPTLNAENGSRGNSFYVENKCSQSSGWDPAMEEFGLESYRGDSARIIFYCVVASSSLSLVEKDNDSTSNHTMGRLSHLLKWNQNYAPLEREFVRNDGAESLQGNRNPFIDHPEYACRIYGRWSKYNSIAAVREICG